MKHQYFGQTSALIFLFSISFSALYSQTDDPGKISIQATHLGGNAYFLKCVDGFGGGNVTASIGEEGILLADDMYAFMAPRLEAALKTISDKPVRMVLNSHFHADHIEGNRSFKKSAIIVAHKNVKRHLAKSSKDALTVFETSPTITFTDSLRINFNGEEIQVIHFPNSHTSGDAIIYFPKSRVLHMGDLFFFGMFPAVYAQGGGDIRQLTVTLEKILYEIPHDVKVIPGHGEIAKMRDLANYLNMLKETSKIVELGIQQGKTLEQMKEAKALKAYDALGTGGAQTTDEYLAMLYKLLSTPK